MDKNVLLYICHNCIPEGNRFPRQWAVADMHVKVKEMPCSGKIDIQYLFHALEGGAQGVCVVTCPKGECTLAQGNYRAEVRVSTVQRLLSEIGLEPQRAVLVNSSPEESFEHLKKLVDEAVLSFSELTENPIRSE